MQRALDSSRELFELEVPSAGLRLVWDSGLRRLSFRRSHDLNELQVRLSEFSAFREDVKRVGQDTIEERLGRIVGLPCTLDDVWRRVLSEVAFHLSRLDVAKGGRSTVCSRFESWLGMTSASTAWHLRHDTKVPVAERAALLTAAVGELAMSSGEQLASDVLGRRDREVYWWTLRSRWLLAREWFEESSGAGDERASREALQAASSDYLAVLCRKLHRRELELFFSECGESLEAEVKNVLVGEERRKGLGLASPSDLSPAVHHDQVEEVFILWFLRRYDWWSAVSLQLALGRDVPRFLGIPWYAFLAIPGVLLVPFGVDWFLIEKTAPDPANTGAEPWPSWVLAVGWAGLFLVQVALVVYVLVRHRSLFRLLLPRAAFGSLLAWLTVIVVTVPEATNLQLADEMKGFLYDSWLCGIGSADNALSAGTLARALLGIFLVCLPAIGLLLCLILSEAAMYLRAWKAIFRALFVILCCYAGALFWGRLFAVPLLQALSPQEMQTWALLQTWTIGSAYALLFGTLVQLLWENRFITEPLFEEN